MTSLSSDQLRALVREVVRDAVASAALGKAAPAAPPIPPAPPPASRTVAGELGVTPSGPTQAGERTRTESVRITTDRELDVFVRKLLTLFDNPKNRADIKAGRLTFALTGGARSGAPAARSPRRIERGAVTEQMITGIAERGDHLVLGRKAVLTPLAREKARALGLSIEKERT